MIDFGNERGKAAKGASVYKIKDGENRIRFFGGILPRYVYWVDAGKGKDIPFECLRFDRVKEEFKLPVKDHVPEFFPDVRAQWSYCINCIDLTDGKPYVFALKSKLYRSIKELAKDLGSSPTDPVTGWDIVFKREKTGPSPMNVEYNLAQLKCKPRALTDEELAVIEDEPAIDEKYPVDTPEAQLERLEAITSSDSDDASARAAKKADLDDDIPF